MKLFGNIDLTKTGYFADDFKEMYEVLDYDDPEFWVKNIVYSIVQDYSPKNPRQLIVTATDIYTVPDGEPYRDEKFAFEKKIFSNSFELVHNYKLANGKTIAEIVCEHMGLDSKTTLPVYPDWLTPLGEVKPVETMTDEEFAEIEKSCNEITEYLWEKDKEEMLRDGDLEGLRMYAEAELEVENISDEEFQEWLKADTQKHDDT